MDDENKLKKDIENELVNFLNKIVTEYEDFECIWGDILDKRNYVGKTIEKYLNNIMKIICEEFGHVKKYNKEKRLNYCNICSWEYIGEQLKGFHEVKKYYKEDL